jgi:hypothetical protein
MSHNFYRPQVWPDDDFFKILILIGSKTLKCPIQEKGHIVDLTYLTRLNLTKSSLAKSNLIKYILLYETILWGRW